MVILLFKLLRYGGLLVTVVLLTYFDDIERKLSNEILNFIPKVHYDG